MSKSTPLSQLPPLPPSQGAGSLPPVMMPMPPPAAQPQQEPPVNDDDATIQEVLSQLSAMDQQQPQQHQQYQHQHQHQQHQHQQHQQYQHQQHQQYIQQPASIAPAQQPLPSGGSQEYSDLRAALIVMGLCAAAHALPPVQKWLGRYEFTDKPYVDVIVKAGLVGAAFFAIQRFALP